MNLDIWTAEDGRVLYHLPDAGLPCPGRGWARMLTRAKPATRRAVVKTSRPRDAVARPITPAVCPRRLPCEGVW